ncbi:olfactory receptor 5B12-like [Gastrophryne carolinensis]
MGNRTVLSEFFLSGLSDFPSLQLPLFLFFLPIYLLTLTWNLLIIILIVTDSHLHTPMYFFLGNLASLDISCSSATVPRMLFDLYTSRRVISRTACLTQVFFFLFFAVSEGLLLSVMSYDRYIAICRPLHYMQVMDWRACIHLAFGAWALGFAYSLIHSLCAVKLTFCKVNVIESFFCDLPLLFQITCSDIFINVLLIFLVGGVVAIGSLILTFLSYIFIFKTVLGMQVKDKSSKVFSTCSSHLTVVFVFYGTAMSNYFRPSASSHFAGDKVLSVFYTVMSPLLNPLVYSLRNQDFRTAFCNVLLKIFTNKINS